MFAWLKRWVKKPSPDTDGIACIATPGEIFPWPKGGVITAVEELVIALPLALFDKDRPMGEYVFGPNDMQINIPPDGDKFFIRMLPGMSVSLAKSCDAYVVADDKSPRRMKVRRPQAK